MDIPRFDQRQRLVVCCALGFAAFKAAQSSLYSTAMLTSDTTTILIAGLDFSIVSAAFVILAEAVIVAAALTGRLSALSMPVIAPSAALAIAACLSRSGALSAIEPTLALLFMLRIRKRVGSPEEADAATAASSSEDAFSVQGTEMAARYNLTEREAEIFLLLARGRSSTYSPNIGAQPGT